MNVSTGAFEALTAEVERIAGLVDTLNQKFDAMSPAPWTLRSSGDPPGGDLMAASPRDPSGKDAWHEDRSAQLIYFMLHAAALAGASMREVNTWVCAPPSRAPMTILESRDPEWAGTSSPR